MIRIIIAGVAGALVYFVWGMLAWMALPLHTPTLHGLPTESQITKALTAQGLETGVYVVPWSDDQDDWQDPESAFTKNHAAGPLFSIFYQKEGGAPMNAGAMAGGFVIDLLAAMLAACLLTSVGSCGRSYLCRVGFVTGLGIFVALVGHASYWNWMHFPWEYTLAFIVDVTVGWTLAGLAIAALVRPTVPAATSHAVEERSQRVSRDESKAAAAPAAPLRSDAISLLATLQREARFIDIVKEPLADYSNAQVGAAARDVLRDCGTVLDRLFQLEPVVEQEEGAKIELPQGFDAARYRITGNATGDAPWTGSLAHHGWRAKRCELPQWSGAKGAALVVAAAEVEVE